jgi:hypothetical protein
MDAQYLEAVGTEGGKLTALVQILHDTHPSLFFSP